MTRLEQAREVMAKYDSLGFEHRRFIDTYGDAEWMAWRASKTPLSRYEQDLRRRMHFLDWEKTPVFDEVVAYRNRHGY